MTHVHHLSCATLCPAARRVPGLLPPELVAHCLVVEGPEGLVVVDTGFGTDDVAERGKRLGRPFTALVGPRLDPGQPLVVQLARLGHRPQDVTDIVLTHLDLDHAGGLPDFPHARVHVHARELEAAQRPSPRERMRYIQAHWAHGPDWVEHSVGGDDWFGFGAVQVIGDDVLMVPLHGHTRGHCGVAVRHPSGGWLLHAGDAYFHEGDKRRPRACPPGLRVFQAAMAIDNRQRRENLERLQELYAEHGCRAGGAPGPGEVTVFCAHDRSELEALSSPAG